MEQKERLIEETNKRYAKRRCAAGTKQTVAMYYEYCGYDTDNMTFESYCNFLKENKILYTDAVFARNIIRGVLTESLEIEKELWPVKSYYTVMLEYIDMENEIEKNHYISVSQWNEFSSQMNDALLKINMRGLYKKYLICSMSWYGIQLNDIGKLTEKDIQIKDDSVVVYVSEFPNGVVIKDPCSVKGMEVVVNYDNNGQYLFKSPSKFTPAQVEKLKNDVDENILNTSPGNIYFSGMFYRMTKGYVPQVSEANQYLLAYYEAMSRFLYGEPLDSGEPLSSDEPTFDVEKEAEKYVPLSDWNVYVSTLSRDLLDERNISTAKPYVATFLAWNGIPAELIKLLTTKTLSTDGQEKLFIGNGINEIEIEANKRTCDIVGRLIIEEPPGVLFEDPHNFTREEGRRVGYIFGQPPVLNTDIEIVYTSGILYRLAKFGQEPDDKENLNYYKAVADYMYKGDD